MAKQWIGLDIGSSSVKAVQLRRKGTGWALQAFGMQPLVPQTIVDGAIMDQGAVADAIRQLWQRLKLKQKEVAIAIAGHSVIIKKIAVPQMTADQLAANIRNEAEHHIPFGKDDVELDYHVTNAANSSGQTELLLVAAKKEVVSDYVQVVRDGGLSPQVVDVAAFASQNGFEANYPLDPRETIVLINVGAAISNINIVRSGVSMFTRDVTIGGNAFTEEIQKQLNIAADEAEAYKVGGSQTEDGVVPQEVVRVMEGVAEVMAGEFQRSLDFFLATTADANVTRIVLAGGSAKIPSLHRAIERRSRLPLEVADAWKRIEIDPSLDRTYLQSRSPEALIGVGLGMRGAGAADLSKIRINLLTQRKKAKRVSVAGPSSKHIVVGAGALGAAAAAVFLLVDMPKRSELSDLRERNEALQTQINQKKQQLAGYDKLKKDEEDSQKRADAINRLVSNKVVPAHLLHELGRILTREGPTMTERMVKLAGNGPESDPNKRFAADWDTTHVWMSSFQDTAGAFKLEGGAQSESDVTQLSKRLAASVYFQDVTPAGGERVADRDTGMNYYKFTITGRVAY
ncbi:MAG: type IV pilus assembly protein PilM [Kofleriaceae bacterium]